MFPRLKALTPTAFNSPKVEAGKTARDLGVACRSPVDTILDMARALARLDREANVGPQRLEAGAEDREAASRIAEAVRRRLEEEK